MKKRIPNFRKNLRNLAVQDEERIAQLAKVEREAIANYRGTAMELGSALGMLRLGDHLGWRALLIIHSKRTIKKYEDILNIEVRDFFEEEGPIAERSAGYKFTKHLSNYWKAVSGDIKVENRKELS